MWGHLPERLAVERALWEMDGHGSPPGPRGLLKLEVCWGTTPGAFIHNPSAEEVLQPLIQAGGCPVLLTGPRYWRLLGGKSCRIYHLGEEALLPSTQGLPLWTWTCLFLAPWKLRPQDTWAFLKLGDS